MSVLPLAIAGLVFVFGGAEPWSLAPPPCVATSESTTKPQQRQWGFGALSKYSRFDYGSLNYSGRTHDATTDANENSYGWGEDSRWRKNLLFEEQPLWGAGWDDDSYRVNSGTVPVLHRGEDSEPSEEELSSNKFPAGTREVSLRVGHSGDRFGKHEAITALDLDYGIYFRENLSLRGHASGQIVHDSPDGFGLGSLMGFRYHFAHRGRWSFYGEGAGGFHINTVQFPRKGTRFNFTYLGAIGTTFRLGRHTYLESSGRFQHVSNGFIQGNARNPAANVVGIFTGISVTF